MGGVLHDYIAMKNTNCNIHIFKYLQKQDGEIIPKPMKNTGFT